jgi:opacity protein-like surface antigen
LKPSVSSPPRRVTLVFVITVAALTTPSFAQTEAQTNTNTPAITAPCTPTQNSSTPPQPCNTNRHPDTSVSLGVFPQLTLTRTQEYHTNPDYISQSAARSAGGLATFRQTFRSWLGYSVNFGYTRLSQQYRSDYNFNIDSSMYETSIAYVAQTPVNKRFSLFGDLGPGLFTFTPTPDGSASVHYPSGSTGTGQLVPDTQVRPGAVFGSGVDIHVTHRFDFRAEYRGLVYNNPDFHFGLYPDQKRFTISSEPTLSVVYHLSNPKP